MANILTADEAAVVLRVDATDQAMLDLLPVVDAFIRGATGRDWTSDSPISAQAKAAARILLVMWYENPGQVGTEDALSFGMTAVLAQLEALALRYKSFEGRIGAGAVSLPGAVVGDTVSSLVGVVGVSGDRSADFESVITVANEIQQVSASDLTGMFYRVFLTPLEYL